MHLEYPAGQMVVIDFAGDKMCYTDRATGEVIFCPVLIAILPYSGLFFVMALADASLIHTMEALNVCFCFFGGVPQALKTDNMKQIVTRPSRYEPVFTEAFTQWAQHYNIAISTARVAKPKVKPLWKTK